MKTIQTSDTQDIFLDGNGNIALSEDILAVENICENAVLTLKGELRLDTLAGIPYFDIVFGAHPNLELFKKYIIETLEKVEGVLSARDFNVDFGDGILKYSVTIETKYGEAVLNG